MDERASLTWGADPPRSWFKSAVIAGAAALVALLGVLTQLARVTEARPGRWPSSRLSSWQGPDWSPSAMAKGAGEPARVPPRRAVVEHDQMV